MSNLDDTRAVNPPKADNMSSALSMAAEIFASSQESVPSAQPQKPEATADTAPSNEELAAMLAQMLSSKSSASEESAAASPAESTSANSPSSPAPPDSGSGLGSIAAILPPLMQAFSGGGNFIKPEKLNLITALKPYMSEARGSSIDRAIKMANIAQAAKTAFTALGR